MEHYNNIKEQKSKTKKDKRNYLLTSLKQFYLICPHYSSNMGLYVEASQKAHSSPKWCGRAKD
jgi:hypothetical protein